MDALLRLLELVRRELEANDAHLQLGGAAPHDAHALAHELRPSLRLVVRFAEPPVDPAAMLERMAELAGAFSGTVTDAIELLDTTLTRASSGDELVDVLVDLREATGAAVALVIDRQSPIIWGCSDPGLGLRDLPVAIGLADAFDQLHERGLDPVREAAATEPSAHAGDTSLVWARRALQLAERAAPGGAAKLVVAARALATLQRDREGATEPDAESEIGIASKEFGGLYRVVLVFSSPYSPLRVEGVLRRALPVIERHVLELPPLDPTPKGGRVVPLRRD